MASVCASLGGWPVALGCWPAFVRLMLMLMLMRGRRLGGLQRLHRFGGRC